MGTSPNRSYPYPAGSDAVDVPGDMEALADAVDTDMAAVIAGTGLADGAVTTAKIADGSVTDAKLAVPKVDQSVVGNLLPGGFADATDLTLATGSGAAVTADSTNYLVGSSSFLVTASSNAACGVLQSGWSYTVAYDGEPITFSGWVRAQFAGSVSAFWRVFQNGVIQSVLGSLTATVQDTWVLVQATTTQFSEGDVLTDPFFRVNTTTAGQAWSVDKLGIWQGAGGLWAPPGTPIANLGIRANPATSGAIQEWDSATSAWVDQVPTSRTITAGTGLTGGGDLSANRTLSVDTGGIDTAQLADGAVTNAKSSLTAVNGADIAASGSNLALGGGHTALTTGTVNTSVGDDAGAAITSGANNAALGYRALYNNTTGNNNVAVGSNALLTNTTGSSNVAAGRDAQRSLTTGSNNVAAGAYAQYSLTTGLNNVATGALAQYSLTTGSSNVAAGYAAQYSLTTGSYNVATGHVAQYALTTGSSNVAAGHAAQRFLTTGSDNVAAGSNAGRGFVTGNYNVSVGSGAAYTSQSDVSNTTVIGASAYTTQAGGIAIGKSAAATTAGEVQIGVASGAEKPTALRVGTNRLVTVAEFQTVVAGAVDLAALQIAVAAITD